jgi:hypothetical protein
MIGGGDQIEWKFGNLLLLIYFAVLAAFPTGSGGQDSHCHSQPTTIWRLSRHTEKISAIRRQQWICRMHKKFHQQP